MLLNISFRYVQSENTSEGVVGPRISDLFAAKVTGLPSCFRLRSDNVLEMSVKLKFWCVRLEKKHCFACWFELVSYSENKEMIYESVNLKGAEYEPKQNSSSLQSITTCTCLETLARSFIKCIHWLITTRFCKARGRLVLQMQGLSFLEKLVFWLLHKNGS